MNQKKHEHRALIVGIIFNIVMGVAGICVYHVTKIEALFLDAYFTLVAVLSGIVAVIISKRSSIKSKSFPYGHYFLEPLYAVLKSMLTLVLLGYTTISVTKKAMDYFLYGIGEVMNYGPVIPYEIIMVVMCFSLSCFYWRQNKRTNDTSTMLAAEARSTIIDGIMSGGIGVGVILMVLLNGSGADGVGSESPFSFLLYTGDFFITITLVAFSVKEPVKLLKEAFIELTNGIVTNETLKAPIVRIVSKHLPENTELKDCHIHKVGMHFRISVYLHSRSNNIDKAELHEKVVSIEDELSHEYENTSVSFAFS